MLTRVLSAVALACAAIASAQEGLDLFGKGESCYLLVPPMVASDGIVEKATWSPDGRYVATVRMPPRALTSALSVAVEGKTPEPPELIVSVWTMRTGVTKEVARYPAGTQSSSGWFGSAFGVLYRRDGRSMLTLFRPGANSLSTQDLGLDEFVFVPSEGGPYAALVAAQDSITVLADSGATVRRYGLPGLAIWVEGGRTLAVVPPNGSVTLIDPATNRVRSAPQSYLGSLSPDPKRSKFRISEDPDGGSGRRALRVSVAEIEDSVRLGWDVSEHAISPNDDAVLYVSQGIALVRQIVPVDEKMLIAAREAALRTALISNAKQVATALIMLASDNGDNLPDRSGWEDRVYPYLKSREVMAGFIYTYGGGPMDQIANPAETELGYVAGPGGRAVAYADGHVKWVPDK